MVYPEVNMEARWQEAIAQCPRSFLASFLDTLSPRLICVGTWSTGHGLNGDYASYLYISACVNQFTVFERRYSQSLDTNNI